jgi:FkbM family methyltransferase
MQRSLPKPRFYELNFHIPKLQLLEVFPLTPFLERYENYDVFDVGANTGLWGEAFLKTNGAKTRNYVMFEPMSGNLEHITRRDNLLLSKMAENTKIVGAAVGAETGEIDIHFDKEVTTLASISNNQSEFGTQVVDLSHTRKVPMTIVDFELQKLQIDTLQLMKIDVEGYELNVMEGAKESLRAGRVRNIYFEFGIHQTKNNQSFKDFYDFLSGFGYTLYKSVRGRNFFGLAPIKGYQNALEPQDKSVEMILASLDGPDPKYTGPRVIGQPI